MARRITYRVGFTTIELLVVLAIVGLLGAIAASAVFRVRATSEKSATEQTITKLASALDVHWKAVIDAAKKEYDGLPAQIKQNLVALADNTTKTPVQPAPHPRRDDRARLLYVKFRLKQEFPTSFTMAVNPAPNFLPQQTVGTLNVTGKPAYVKEVAAKTSVDPAIQSSALLVLSLKQTRSGVPTTAIDQMVGSTFLRETQGLTYIIDTWGQPLQFFAFPAYPLGEGPSTTDLDVGPITVPTTPAGQSLANVLKTQNIVADPQDPEGLLVFDTTSNTRWDRRMDMNRYLHPQFTNMPSSPRQFMLRRMVPVIASAGPDQDLGGNAAANNNPHMSLPRNGSFDNIYSFRLRQTGARGD